jgi:hypothetical protein
MPRDLVPELHDCLKLTTYKHTFSDFPQGRFAIPGTRSWQGVLQHHCKEAFPALPVERETFLLHLSDCLASNFSRPEGETEGAGQFTVHTLWNPGKHTKDLRLTQPQEISDLLAFYAKDPSAEEFFVRYDTLLRARPEDAHPTKNITSLKTHLALTGKFFRLLEPYDLDQGEITQAIQPCKTNEERASALRLLANKKRDTFKMTIADCRFHFRQMPMRAVDLNIFQALEELVSEIGKRWPDSVIFRTPEQVVLALTQAEALDEIASLAQASGFWLDVAHFTHGLSELRPNPRSLKRKEVEREHRFGDLQPQIAPPLCEICQMAPATKTWKPEEEGPLTLPSPARGEGDLLCETCYNIRSKGSLLRKLPGWTTGGNALLSWVKLTLDYDQLNEALHKLYWEYLKTHDPATPEDQAEVRFSLVAEFQQDYQDALKAWEEGLSRIFGSESSQRILGDFYCLRLRHRSEAFKLIATFRDLIVKYFPKFIECQPLPIRFSAVLADSQYPFYECWRILSEAKEDVTLTIIGRGSLRVPAKELGRLIALPQVQLNKSALIKLSEIAKMSESLAKLHLENRSEKDYTTYRNLKEAMPLGLDFRSLLVLAALLEDRG